MGNTGNAKKHGSHHTSNEADEGGCLHYRVREPKKTPGSELDTVEKVLYRINRPLPGTVTLAHYDIVPPVINGMEMRNLPKDTVIEPSPRPMATMVALAQSALPALNVVTDPQSTLPTDILPIPKLPALDTSLPALPKLPSKR
jgi:hypothetical protein